MPAEAEAVAAAAWAEVDGLAAAEGLRPPPAPGTIRIGPATRLAPGVAAASRPGLVTLRPGLPIPGAGGRALRHEVAHQYLLATCAPASGDRLFHEAFALAASGELADWAREDGYLPLARALGDLGNAPHLDTPAARRAIARLLADAPAPRGRLPRVLARRLAACEPGAPWTALRPEDLASEAAPSADALVVLSRHTGEVLRAEGAATLPQPFGSTLKPFLVAGFPGAPPALPPDPRTPGWRCGDPLPPRMDAATALLRSCNGWFLDWARSDPRAAGFGSWAPALSALGLSAPPADASEAIGVRPSLRISALGIAQAYRLLAEARPDLLDVLSRSAREGTLSGLAASASLRGVAAKTGTVLDAAAAPRLGWIAAVDRDLVVVMARAGRTPRTFARELAAVLAGERASPREAARVQVFGLVDAETVTGRCSGIGFSVAGGTAAPLPPEDLPLLSRARAGPLVCSGGIFAILLPGAREPRPYAGVFAFDPAPEVAAPPSTTARERRARRGSDLVFRTTRLAYAAGVVEAEDAASRGEARIALGRVADSNAAHSRHPGRPVCDTTHCQVFQGSSAPRREERKALAAPLAAGRWLPFARGGTERWTEARSAAAVRSVLGAGARALTFGDGRVRFLASETDGRERWEERRDLPCEALRGPLKLPSCPDRAVPGAEGLVFEGRGEGHGEGLDVEWAKRSGLGAEEILSRAYPFLR